MSDIQSFFGGGGSASKKEIINPPPDFNRVDYESLTQQKRKEYIRSIMDKIGLCESVKSSHPQLYEILTEDIIPVHAEYPKKCKGMVDLTIRNNEMYGSFKQQLECWIKFENSPDVPISLLKGCVTGKPKSSMQNLQEACRVAIDPQTNAYRNAHKTQPCVKCNCLSYRMEVDHNYDELLQFQTLFENFMDECKIDNVKIPETFDKNKGNQKCFKPTDSDFEKRWQQYHHDHAILRMLCFDCNRLGKKNI